VTNKIISMSIVAFLIVALLALSSFVVAGHSEQGEGSLTSRDRIEQTEQKVLGNESYQKLEIVHTTVEKYPIIFGIFFMVLIFLAIFMTRHFLKRRYNKK